VRAAAYRENVANEIFQTEKDYVANLGLLFDTFLHPIKEHMTGTANALRSCRPRMTAHGGLTRWGGQLFQGRCGTTRWHPAWPTATVLRAAAASARAGRLPPSLSRCVSLMSLLLVCVCGRVCVVRVRVRVRVRRYLHYIAG
jgi:hypothetical protein